MLAGCGRGLLTAGKVRVVRPGIHEVQRCLLLWLCCALPVSLSLLLAR